MRSEWNIIIVSSKSQTKTRSTSFSDGGELIDNELGDEERPGPRIIELLLLLADELLVLDDEALLMADDDDPT